MPASGFSPPFRARTNMAISCCLLLTGKPVSRWSVSVAQPSAPLDASGGIAHWLYGVAVA